MTRQKSSRLTDVELEVMQVMWQLGGATVRQVHEVLSENRQVAYTTVMTMMNILEEKEYLRRSSKEGRAYVYEPVQPKGEVIASMVDDFVGRVLDGSARPLVAGLVQRKKLSKRDLDEIARIIEEADEP
jgi:BlaI family transcriptional regulator, penicillinase repressor